MTVKYIIILLCSALLSAGCSAKPAADAGLRPLTQPAERWQVAENLQNLGEGNVYRSVAGNGLGAPEALELAAGRDGLLRFSRSIEAGTDAAAAYRLKFLSTQGIGRLTISASDADGKPLGLVGWVFTGALPDSAPAEKWLDVRYQSNYTGDWLPASLNFREMLTKYLPEAALARAARYTLSVETGQGQHCLITDLSTYRDEAKSIVLLPEKTELRASQGDMLTVSATVENISGRNFENVKVEAKEPFGSGLIVEQEPVREISLPPGAKAKLSWQVKAQRPDNVNLNKPWVLEFAAGGSKLAAEVKVAVSDPKPGQVFYVMTEDLEPMDSAGYPVRWGNADGWLNPEEFSVQMVNKAEALDRIAEQSGARWTHYIAWPAMLAAEWAGRQSTTGKWQQVAEQVKQSVRQETARGHEYGIHLHMDYDPELPGNVLSYNAANDGLWANHLQHGWAHSIAAEGNYNDAASRIGSLFRYQRILDELSAGSPLGQLLTARAGSFDFGYTPDGMATSIRAFHKVGLWGSTDADGNIGGITSGSYGREVYLTRPDTINLPADNLATAGIIEFRPTPRDFIAYDGQSAKQMNVLADQGMQTFRSGGANLPGIHAIVGFTHAMFVMGSGDWKSTSGGQFQAIDDHLRYLKERYVDAGLLKFGTASELVRAYLDYYSPILLGVYGNRTKEGVWESEYEIKLLGRDIPADAVRPQTVRVKYPLYLRDSAFRISILKNGQTVASSWGYPTPDNDVTFTVDDKNANYSIKIYHNKEILRVMHYWQGIKSKIFR